MQRTIRRNSVDQLSRSVRAKSGKIRKSRLRVEALEERCLLSTLTWTGTNSGNWSDTGNWSGGVAPSAGSTDTLVFPTGGLNQVMNNDIAGLTEDIQFTGGSYDITGNTFSLGSTGVQVSSSVSSQIDADVNIATNTSIQDNGTLLLTGTLTGSSPTTLTLSGSTGTTTYGGASLFTGSTLVAEGTLDLNSGTATTMVGPLQIGGVSGFTNPASVVGLGPISAFGSNPDVTVNSNGTLDLSGEGGGVSETVNNLTISDGIVSPAPSGLSVAGSLSMTGGSINSGSGSVFLTGGSLTATSSASSAVIAAPLNLSASSATFTVNAGSSTPDLVVQGAITNGSYTKTGGGILELTGAGSSPTSVTVSGGDLTLTGGEASARPRLRSMPGLR